MKEAPYKPPTFTPQIFSDLFEYYEESEIFIDALTKLINIHGIDSKLEMRDFLIAEMIRNNLVTLYNTLKENKKLQGNEIPNPLPR